MYIRDGLSRIVEETFRNVAWMSVLGKTSPNGRTQTRSRNLQKSDARIHNYTNFDKNGLLQPFPELLYKHQQLHKALFVFMVLA